MKGSSDSFSYEVSTPVFKGPIELLYSLIQKKSLDINEISLSLVTEDFLVYVKNYKEIEHYRISEFIEVSVQLLYLKSIKLLPFQEEELLYDDDRLMLVERLIEYSKMKKGFEFLRQKQQGILFERKENPLLKELKNRYEIKEISLRRMIHIIEPFLLPEPSIPLSRGEITIPTQTVEQRASWFLGMLEKVKNLSVFKLFSKLKWADKVISFIALLELSKQGKVSLFQADRFEDITISKGNLKQGARDE